MGYTAINTADVGSTSRWSSVSGTVTISNTTARTGTYSFCMNGGSSLYQTLPGTTGYIKFCGYWTTATISDYRCYIKEDGVDHLTLIFQTTSGTLQLRRGGEGGTVIAESGSISLNTWYCIEIYYVIDNSSGVCQIRLNGVEAINFSGDTCNGGTCTPNMVRLYANASYMYVDDFAIRDDTWCGVGGIRVLVPDGSGDTTSWTASAGNDYDCVNEQPPDFTDYIYTDAATINTVHLFTLSNLPVTPDSIACVAVCAYAKLDASGSGNLRGKMKYGGTTTEGSSVGLSTSPLWVDYYKETDPGGSSWNATSVNGLQAGVETI